MKNHYLLLFLLVFIAFGPNSATAQGSDQESARSAVVKIKTSYMRNQNGRQVKSLGVATGWCWKEPTLVVTALHAVSGNSEITVYKDATRSTKATVIKVLKEADLALLRLSSNIGLTPLTLKDADPNSGREYYVWGFPHGVYSVQGDDIRFSRSLERTPTLNSILTGNKLKADLEAQGYPLPGARILRISSTIQPGHSGAPILANDGTVIGIADGGLRDGTARINWAMPASYYVPRLDASNDAFPTTASVQVSLYSSVVEVDMDATEEEEIRVFNEEAIDNTVVNGNRSISKTWTAGYPEILGTMTEEDIYSMIAITELFGVDMSDTRYDVYEDFETGATITVPFGENFSVKDGWFFVSNSTGTLIYDALPFYSETFVNAVTNSVSVFTENFPENLWVSDPQTPDQGNGDEVAETASYTLTRYANDGSGRVLYYVADVKGPDLLIAFLIYDMGQLANPDYLKQYLHYALAMQMRAFANY